MGWEKKVNFPCFKHLVRQIPICVIDLKTDKKTKKIPCEF